MLPRTYFREHSCLHLSFFDKHYNQKQLGRGKDLLAYTSTSPPIIEGHHSRISRHELNEAETLEERYLLTCSLAPVQVAFLYNPEPLPKDCTAHNGLGLPTPMRKPENSPTDISIGRHDCGSSPITLSCVKLTAETT